jgi:hypothetical protein
MRRVNLVNEFTKYMTTIRAIPGLKRKAALVAPTSAAAQRGCAARMLKARMAKHKNLEGYMTAAADLVGLLSEDGRGRLFRHPFMNGRIELPGNGSTCPHFRGPLQRLGTYKIVDVFVCFFTTGSKWTWIIVSMLPLAVRDGSKDHDKKSGEANEEVASASGYYFGSLYFHKRATSILLIQMLMIAGLTQLLIYWLGYATTVLDDGRRMADLVSFGHYLDFSLTKAHYRIARLAVDTGEVGTDGYLSPRSSS